MRLRVSLMAVLAVWAISAGAQDQPAQGYVLHPHQEIKVAPLPSIMADSRAEADVVSASVATALMDPEICCGRNSALEDQVGSISRLSLKELGAKVRGKHYLGDGSPVVIKDDYWPAASVNVEQIVGTLQAQRPLLMTWNGHTYVVYGAVFNEYVYDSGVNAHVIEKLLLLDTRFDGDRRYVTFDRQTDDWGNVTGLLSLTVTR